MCEIDHSEIKEVLDAQNIFVDKYNDYNSYREYLYGHLDDTSVLPPRVTLTKQEAALLNYLDDEQVPGSLEKRQEMLKELIRLRNLFEAKFEELFELDNEDLFDKEVLEKSKKESQKIVEAHKPPFSDEDLKAATIDGVVYYDLLDKKLKKKQKKSNLK